MEGKWQRQQINQISGAYLVLDNLLLNQSELFTPAERELLQSMSQLLQRKGEELRKGSPGGG